MLSQKEVESFRLKKYFQLLHFIFYTRFKKKKKCLSQSVLLYFQDGGGAFQDSGNVVGMEAQINQIAVEKMAAMCSAL